MADYTFDRIIFYFNNFDGTAANSGLVGNNDAVASDGNGGDTNFTPGEAISGSSHGTQFHGTYAMPLSGGGTQNVAVLTDGFDYFVLIPDGRLSTDFAAPATLTLADIDTVSAFAVCFAKGTLIATPSGEVAVETLSIGDKLRGADGKTVDVKWIGRQTIEKRRMAENSQPVCIRAGALGDGLPQSDLTVTADHGMVMGEFVINASALVNGDTVDFVPMEDLENSFVVYHIETEAHDVVLANGAPAETFVDAVTRSHFDNYQEYLDLYDVERIIPEMGKHRINAQRLLPQAIKARLGIKTTDLRDKELLRA